MKRIWVIEAPGKKDAFLRALSDADLKGELVLATYGRLYDLPDDDLGFDPSMISQPTTASEIHWEPKRADQVRKLIDLLSQGDEIAIATDSDLEGELIASQVEGLCLIAQRNRSQPQTIRRVHIAALTGHDLKHGLNNAGEIEANRVRAAKARRVLDRLLGYRLHDPEDPWRLSIGRVVTPLVASLLENPGEAVVVRKKLDEGWSAIVRLETTQAIHADTLLGILHALPPPQLSVTATTAHEFEYKPLTGPEALSLCMRSLSYSPSQIQASIQQSYERGRLSYPRTDSRTLSEVGLKWIERAAGREGVPFDPALANTRQSEVMDRSYDAHQALLPLGDDIAASSIPSSFLSIDQAVIRCIASHSAHIGEPAEAFTREIGNLSVDDPASIKWAQVLKAWGSRLSFVRDTDPSGFRQDPLRHELARAPDRTEAMVAKWTHSPTQVVMERLISLGLGRPSTLLKLSEKAFTSYLDSHGSVNGRGRIMIEKVMRRLPELLSPEAARSIEDVVSDVSQEASIGTRLSRAWEILKKNPVLLGTGAPSGVKTAPAADKKPTEIQGDKKIGQFIDNTYGMY
jgi:DNA topoisomerase IA